MAKRLFTSESVTDGHPDKVCDILSDTVLDAYLALDPYARVACECCATTGLAVVMGEITSKACVEVTPLIRSAIRDIGYDDPCLGFDADNCAVLVALGSQSPDIAQGVDKSLEARQGSGFDMATGAGDQGMMFGYACSDTDEYMPLPIYLAHKLTRKLSAARRGGSLPWLRPDGKTQVTVEYDGDVPKRLEAIVVSAQHAPEASQQEIRAALIEQIIRPTLPEGLVDGATRIYVNPTGRFVIGGPHGDSGLTGRKIIVDTYGGWARHGGGAFSGKDPTKVDRSASYAARYLAKNIVAAGLAARCEIQLAYAIGVAEPVSVSVDTFGTGKAPDERLIAAVRKCFDLRPEAMIRALDLRRPIYRRTASFGHFGDPAMPWEKLDLVEKIANEV
ncbi:MAG: S-adenosylmethionine synthase [Firmicutes bacterium ADurb.Bin248]|nr:MAG: S-adenosylmethionine synthase [Firmicutes bacterium ADurb.Bin248]HOG00851.1 methionine adenosyltransferase [Clostridia bacterium]